MSEVVLYRNSTLPSQRAYGFRSLLMVPKRKSESTAKCSNETASSDNLDSLMIRDVLRRHVSFQIKRETKLYFLFFKEDLRLNVLNQDTNVLINTPHKILYFRG